MDSFTLLFSRLNFFRDIFRDSKIRGSFFYNEKLKGIWKYVAESA